jgi:hypothetical protein
MKNSALLLFVTAVCMLAALPAFSQAPIKPRTAAAKPQLYSSTGRGDGVLPHIADGQGWQTIVTVVNLRPTSTTVNITCNNDSGSPQAFEWAGIGAYASLQGPLAGYGSLEITTQGAAATTVTGYCLVNATGAAVNDIAALAIYAYAPTGFQVAVPTSPVLLTNTLNSLILAFDNTNGYQYGVALVDTNTSVTGNPGDTVNWSVRDTGGTILATGSIRIAPLGHTAFLLANAIPATANLRGTVTFTIVDTVSDPYGAGTLAGLGLRAAPQGAITSVDMFEPMTY